MAETVNVRLKGADGSYLHPETDDSLILNKTVKASGVSTDNAFEIADDSNHVILAIDKSGNLKTKKFDSTTAPNDVKVNGTSVVANNEVNIPIASKNTLGVVKAASKTDDMTQAVGIAADGTLYAEAGGSEVSVSENSTQTVESKKANYIKIDTKEYKVGGTAVSVSTTGSASTDPVKYITIDGTESKLPYVAVTGISTSTTDALSAAAGNSLNTAIANKAPLENGKIPVQYLPEGLVGSIKTGYLKPGDTANFYKTRTGTEGNYEYSDPYTGSDLSYSFTYVDLATNKSYRYTTNGSTTEFEEINDKTQYKSLTPVSTTVGGLCTEIGNINTNGGHVFLDLYGKGVVDGYVCTVHFWDNGASDDQLVKYCFIYNILNNKVYYSTNGYTDDTTIEAYCSGKNELGTYYALKTPKDATMTMAQLKAKIDEVNGYDAGTGAWDNTNNAIHVFLDLTDWLVNSGAYVCTIYFYTNEAGTIKYCKIHDLLNNRILFNPGGYSDSETVVDYLASANTWDTYYSDTMAAESTLKELYNKLENVNGESAMHVFMDLSNNWEDGDAYVCTIHCYQSDSKYFIKIKNLLEDVYVFNKDGYASLDALDAVTISAYCANYQNKIGSVEVEYLD